MKTLREMFEKLEELQKVLEAFLQQKNMLNSLIKSAPQLFDPKNTDFEFNI
jgi:hypothetical protein